MGPFARVAATLVTKQQPSPDVLFAATMSCPLLLQRPDIQHNSRSNCKSSSQQRTLRQAAALAAISGRLAPASVPVTAPQGLCHSSTTVRQKLKHQQCAAAHTTHNNCCMTACRVGTAVMQSSRRSKMSRHQARLLVANQKLLLSTLHQQRGCSYGRQGPPLLLLNSSAAAGVPVSPLQMPAQHQEAAAGAAHQLHHQQHKQVRLGCRGLSPAAAVNHTLCQALAASR